MRTSMQHAAVRIGSNNPWYKSVLRAGASALVVSSAISAGAAFAQDQAEPAVEDTASVEEPQNEIIVSGLRA